MKKNKKLLVLGLITARGGSKGIPGKNIINLNGKPLIAWTIESAKKSKLIDRLVLSTDDEKIAAVGKKCGAETPFTRPKEISEDDTPDLPVFEHTLRWLEKNEGWLPNLVVHLRPTAPLRRAEDIDKAIKLLTDNPEADSLRAIAPAPHHPLKTYRLDKNNWLEPFVPDEVYGIKEAFNLPRQALPKAFAAKGYLSVIRSRTILEKKSMTGEKILGMEIDSRYFVDIDKPEDLKLAAQRLKELS